MKKSLFLLLLLTFLFLSGCGARPPVTRDREAVLSWINTLPADEAALSARSDLAVMRLADRQVSEGGRALWRRFREKAEKGQAASFVLVTLSGSVRATHYVSSDAKGCRLLIDRQEGEKRRTEEISESSLIKLLTHNCLPVEALEPWEPAEYPVYPTGRNADEILTCFAAFPADNRELLRMPELSVSGQSAVAAGGWIRFYDSVTRGEPACVSFVQNTMEGDPIFCYLDYDGTDYYYLVDSSRDSYGGGYYEAVYTALTERAENKTALVNGKTRTFHDYFLSGGADGERSVFSWREEE